MSNNVDNRVVRMTFDNAQFEKNIKNTMQTLSNFEEKLKFSGAAKGFEALKSAADKITFSALGKNADDVSKKMSNMAIDAKNSLDAMQKNLDKADFSGLGSSADKAAFAVNSALASINFDDLDKKSQETLLGMMNQAGQIDFSSITTAAGKVDFSALSDNAAIAIGAVMDLAGDVNFNGMATNAELAMSDVNSAISDVDFTSLGIEANDAISQVNTAAGQTDMSPISNAAWNASAQVTEAISGMNLYSIVDATDEASRGFQIMETIAVGALLNIGSKITDLVTNLGLAGLGKIKDAVISPITDGLNEYQTQIGSIQTILANTGRDFHSSSDIAEVNSVLDDLNLYADKTIYNFTEMVRNIGMFTAAGTDLYDSADAIKGLANLAALQGADSASASRAMYQMSQAMASGTIRLMDWRSLENAGMGGKIFRDVVLDAAAKKYEQQGDTDTLEEILSIKSGKMAFNESLEDKWFTSDILLESLQQLTYAFDDLDDSTKVLTDSERLDLEEKKKEADAHLKSMGYTQEEIDKIYELGQKAQESATQVRTFAQLVDTVGEALGSGWAQSWRYILGDFEQTTELMTKISTAVTTVIQTYDNARNNMLAEWSNWGGWQELWGGTRTIYSKDEKGNILKDKDGNPIIEDTYEVVGALDHILEALSKPLQAFRDAFAEVFGDFFTGEHLYDLTKAFNDFTESLIMSESATQGLKGIFEAVFTVVKAVFQIGTHVVQIGGSIIGVIREITDPLFDAVLSIFGITGEGFTGVVDSLLNVENGVFNFINGALTTLKDILHTIITGLTGGVNIGDILEDTANRIGIFIINVLDFFGMVPKDIDSTLPLPEIFKQIYDSARDNLSKAMDKIIDAIPGLRDFITVMSGDNKEAKIQFFVDIFNRIKDVVLPVVTVLAAPIVILKDAIVGLINAFINLKPVQDFIGWINDLKDSAINWLLELPGKITKTANDLGQAFDVLMGNTKISEVSDDVKKIVNEIGDINITTPFVLLGKGISSGLKTIIGALKTGFGEVSEYLFGWLDDDPKKFTEGLKNFVSGIPGSFRSIEGELKKFAKMILPDKMNKDIDEWFSDTYLSISQGVNKLVVWISDTTAGSKTVPDALIKLVSGGWEAMVNAIKNFDPQEAANNILTKLDELKTTILTSTGGFLDYIFGFKKEKVLGINGYEYEGFTFTEFFTNISNNISKGIEEAKKTVNSLFGNEDSTIFDKITGFFLGDTDESGESSTITSKITKLSKNLEIKTTELIKGFVETITDPGKTFVKVSKFIDDHKDDIYTPLNGITNWIDTTLFPNSDKIFTTGLENIRKSIDSGITEIHKFLEPVFIGAKSWPDFFLGVLNGIAESIGSGIGGIIAYFNSPDFSFTKMFNDIETAAVNFIESTREKFPVLADIIGGVAMALSPIFAVISGLFGGVEESGSKSALGLQQSYEEVPISFETIFGGIKDTLLGLWDTLLNAINEKLPGAKEAISGFFDDILGKMGIFKEDTEEKVGGITDAIGGFFSGLLPVKEEAEKTGVADTIAGFINTLCDALNTDKLKEVGEGIITIGIGVLVVNIGRLVGSLKGVLDNMRGKESFSEKLKDIAEAIAIITGCVWVLSTIEEGAITRATDALKLIVVLLGIMEGLELGVSAIAKKFNIEAFSSTKDSAIEIAAIAASVKVLGDMNQDQIDKATIAIIALKSVITAIDTLGNMVVAGVVGSKGIKIFEPVKSSVTEILALAFATMLLSFIDLPSLAKAELAIGALGGVMLGFQTLSGKIAQTSPASILAVDALAKAAVKLAASVLIMCLGFGMISDADWATLAVAEGGIALIIGIFGLVAKVTNAQDCAATAKALCVAGVAVVEMCFGFSLLEDMRWETLAAAETGVALIIGIFGLVAKFTNASDCIATAQALCIAGIAVVEMCAGFWIVKDVNNEVIKIIAIAVDSIMVIFGLIAKFTKAEDVVITAAALAIAGASVVEMCAGFWIAKDIEPESIKSIAIAVDSIMVIFGLIAAFTGAEDVIVTAAALAIAGASVIEICSGFKMLDGMNVEDIRSISESVSLIMGVMGVISAALSLPIFQAGGLVMIEIAGAFWIFAEGMKALAEGIRALLELEADLPELLDNANEGLSKLGDKVSEHCEIIINGVVDWWNNTVMPKVRDFIDGLVQWWNDTAVPAIMQWFNDFPGKAWEWWTNTAKPAIQKALDDLSKWWNETAKPAIAKWLDELPGKLHDWWTNTAWPTITKMFDELSKWWTGTAWPAIIKFFTKDIPQKVKDWWNNDFKPAVKDIKDKFWEGITGWWDGFKKDVWTAISNWWTSLTKGVSEKLDEWWSGVVEWWADVPNKIMTAIGDLAVIGSNIVTGIINGMVDAVMSNPIVKAVASVGETISNGLNNYFGINSPSKLMRDTVGKGIVEGIGAGMTKYSRLIDKPVIKMGGKTLDYITKYFGIHSPSRLMRDKVGRYIPEGIAAGMDAYATIAVDSAEDLASSISQTIYSGLGDVPTASYGVSAVIDVDSLKTDIELVHEMLRIKIDEVFEAYKEFFMERWNIQSQELLTHIDESNAELYNQLIEYLNANLITSFDNYVNLLINYLESTLPDMTQQILGAFELTNQSLASILQAMTSEQRSAMETAVTQTIVEKLTGLANAVGGSYENKNGKWDIISLLAESTRYQDVVDALKTVVGSADESLMYIRSALGDTRFDYNENTGRYSNFDVVTGEIKETKSEYTKAVSRYSDNPNNLMSYMYSQWLELRRIDQSLEEIYFALGDECNVLIEAFIAKIVETLNDFSSAIVKPIMNTLYDDNNDVTAAESLSYLNTGLFGSPRALSGNLRESISVIEDAQTPVIKYLEALTGGVDVLGINSKTMIDKQQDVKEAIGDLYGHVDNIADLKVVMDSGALVGALAPEINNTIGEAMGYLERTGDSMVNFKHSLGF